MFQLSIFKKIRRIMLLFEYKIRRNFVGFIKFTVVLMLILLAVMMALKLFKFGSRSTQDMTQDRTAMHAKIIKAIKQIVRSTHNIHMAGNESLTLLLKATQKVAPVTTTDPNIKIDWHNYTQIELDRLKNGPGENGRPATSANISKDLVDRLYKVNAYNAALSDTISLRRSVQDARAPNCSKILYRKRLPNVSVIIPFHEEHFSVLLRTVWSIIDRSPEHLIKEVILVDDCSTKEQLKDNLDHYIKKHLPKVKLLRLKPRRGLIVSRLEGAKLATGQVLIFLDSHCETNINWLPPLLDLIAEDYRTCACPFVDAIDQENFAYSILEGCRGGFDWHLQWKVFFKLNRHLGDSTENFENPVMPGGLFAISSRFFWELGGYDEGLYIWGGEQFELSFKIWQCGGRILDVPCSRVAHLYRKFYVFKEPEKNKDYLCMNLRRVAEVWMDDYKNYFYQRQPDCAAVPYGDITKQLQVRKKLNCKPFKWFIEEIAYDVTVRHPLVEPPNIGQGYIKNKAYPNMCIETFREIKINNCSNDNFAQTLQFTWRGEIKYEFSFDCWEGRHGTGEKGSIVLTGCHTSAGNQLWLYDEITKTITNEQTKLCLDTDMQTLFLSACMNGKMSQQWEVQGFNKTLQNKIHQYVKNLRLDGKSSIIKMT